MSQFSNRKLAVAPLPASYMVYWSLDVMHPGERKVEYACVRPRALTGTSGAATALKAAEHHAKFELIEKAPWAGLVSSMHSGAGQLSQRGADDHL